MSVTKWSPSSWRDKPVQQLPEYPDQDALAQMEARLKTYPPLVFAGEARALKEELAGVAAGNGFLLQGGDCAERLDDCAPEPITSRPQGIGVVSGRFQPANFHSATAYGDALECLVELPACILRGKRTSAKRGGDNQSGDLQSIRMVFHDPATHEVQTTSREYRKTGANPINSD